jgi:hypothetical protein
MLIHPVQSGERYPIGSIIEAYAPPNNNWLLCNGQILAQADYPTLYGLMENPHPIFQHWEMINSDMEWHGIYCILYDGSQWVGGCDDGTCYSANGSSWTYVASATYSNNCESLSTDGTIICGSMYSTSGEYITSTDGQTWTERTFPTPLIFYEICCDGTTFYTAAYNATTTYKSTDGINWTAGTVLPFSSQWRSINISSSSVIIVFNRAGAIARSTDGMSTWKVYPIIAAGSSLVSYDSGEDLFTTVGEWDAVYAFSPGDDGIDWEVHQLPYTDNYGYRLKKAGNYWFLISTQSERLAYSSDLRTWHMFRFPYAEWNDVFYDSGTGYYYIVGGTQYLVRWKEVDHYNTSTHFKIPDANIIHDNRWNIKSHKYIRVS